MPTITTASSNVPSVLIDANVKKTDEALALRNLLAEAANELHRLAAWDPALGEIEIIIYKTGKGIGDELPPGIWTDPGEAESSPPGPAQRDKNRAIRIFVEENLFKDGIASRMVRLWDSKKDVALWCLAHEVFHLDEIERKAAVGILAGKGSTAFAGAALRDFPLQWKNALKAFSERYPNSADLSPVMIEAGDIANEASADMTAMHYLKKAGSDWIGFATKLAELREADFKAWKPLTPGLLAAIFQTKAPPRPYQIADALKSFVTQASHEPIELPRVYAKCWSLAVEKIMGAGGFDHSVRERFKDLPKLSAPSPVDPTPPAPTHHAPNGVP